MSDLIYREFRELALELINEFGEAATVYTPEVTGGKDALGRPLPNTPRVDINGFATGKLDYDNAEIDGSVIQSGDCYVFFHSDTSPTVGMYHSVNGETYRIMNVMLIESRTDVVSLCKLQLRK